MQNYGKIYNLGHAAIKELTLEPVLIEEKVDGSQISFGVFNDQLEVHSHRRKLNLDAADMFQDGVNYIRSIKDKITPEYSYRGEYLKKPRHNVLAYDRIPKNHIIIFDIDKAEQDYLDYTSKVMEAERLGFETVPQMATRAINYEECQEFLDKTSILGGTKIEGVVLKNYLRFGIDGKCLMGKYVSEKFKEINRHNSKKETKLGALDRIAAKYRTSARWQKAVLHLEEDGKLKNDVVDIGNIIKEVQRDVLEECGDEIKKELFKWAWKSLSSGLIRGLPQWWKDELMKRQFKEEEGAAAPSNESFSTDSIPF